MDHIKIKTLEISSIHVVKVYKDFIFAESNRHKVYVINKLTFTLVNIIKIPVEHILQIEADADIIYIVTDKSIKMYSISFNFMREITFASIIVDGWSFQYIQSKGEDVLVFDQYKYVNIKIEKGVIYLRHFNKLLTITSCGVNQIASLKCSITDFFLISNFIYIIAANDEVVLKYDKHKLIKEIKMGIKNMEYAYCRKEKIRFIMPFSHNQKRRHITLEVTKDTIKEVYYRSVKKINQCLMSDHLIYVLVDKNEIYIRDIDESVIKLYKKISSKSNIYMISMYVDNDTLYVLTGNTIIVYGMYYPHHEKNLSIKQQAKMLNWKQYYLDEPLPNINKDIGLMIIRQLLSKRTE